MRVFAFLFLSFILFSNAENAYAQIPQNGLKAYFPFNGNAKDASGHYTDSIKTSATITADRKGGLANAYLFNGVNNEMKLPLMDMFPLTDDFTLSFWEKSSSNNRMDPLCLGGLNSGNIDFNFNDGNNALTVYWNAGGDNGHYNLIKANQPNGKFTDGNWYNIILTREGSFLSLYINGSLEGQTYYPDPIGSKTQLVLSGRSSIRWNGALDDIALYDRALTSSEIQQLATGGVHFTFPAVNEAVKADTNYVIQWAADTSIKFLRIDFYDKFSNRIQLVQDSIPASQGFVNWQVPDTALKGYLTLIDIDNPNQNFTSVNIKTYRENKTEYTKYRWDKLTAHASFFPRDGAGAVYFKGKLWLLGGWNPYVLGFDQQTTNEVWSSLDGKNWTLETNAPWQSRHLAGWIVFKDKIWVIGGDENQGYVINDTWNSDDGIHWNKVSSNAPWNERVTHYTVVFDNKLWLMGGQKLTFGNIKGDTVYNDVWNTEDGITWNRVLDHAPWSPRGMIVGSAVFNNKIWILGGAIYDTQVFYNDIWNSSDGVNWTKVTDQAPWSKRKFHNVATFDNKLWVVSGLPAEDDRVWYSSDGLNWNEIYNAGWNLRDAASLFVTPGNMFFGVGYLNNDMWKLVKYLDLKLSRNQDTTLLYQQTLPVSVTACDSCQYSWSKNNVPLSGADQNNLLITSEGWYKVNVTKGIASFTDSIHVLYAPKASLDLHGDSLLDFGTPIPIQAFREPDYIFSWYRDGAKIDSAQTNTLALREPGTYKVKVSKPNGLSKESTTFLLKYKKPILISPSKDTILAYGDQLRLKVLNISAQAKIQWFNNDAAIPQQTSDSLIAKKDGWYYAKVSSGNTSVYTDSIYTLFYPSTYLDKTGEVLLPFGEEYTLKAYQEPDYIFSWYQNDVKIDSAKTNTISFIGEGVYKVKVTKPSGLSAESNSFVLKYKKPLISNSSKDTVLAHEDQLILRVANVGTASFQWFNNDVVLNGQTGDSLKVKKDGLYFSRVSAGDIVVRTDTVHALFYPLARLNKSGDTLLPFGVKLKLTAYKENGYQFEWFKNGVKIDGQNADTFLVSSEGKYNITVKSSAGLSSTSSIYSVKYKIPQFNLTTDTLLGFGKTFTLKIKNTAGCKYKWFKNGSRLLSETKDSLYITDDGTYSAVVVPPSGDEYPLSGIEILFYPLAKIDKTGSVLTTFGKREIIHAFTQSDYQYEWYRNDFKIPNENSGSLQTNGDGKYKLKVIKPSGMTAISDVFEINYINPSLNISGDSILGFGKNILLRVSPTENASYQWYKDDTRIYNEKSDSLLVADDGNYKVEIVSGPSQATAGAVELLFQPLAQVNHAGDSLTPFGKKITLHAFTDDNYTYFWYKNNQVLPNESSDSLSIQSPGTYRLMVKKPSGLKDTSTDFHLSYLQPSFSFTRDTILPFGSTITLRVKNCTDVSYRWYKDGSRLPQATTDSIVINADGTYKAIIVAGDQSLTLPGVEVLIYPKAVLNKTGDEWLTFGERVWLHSNPQLKSTYYEWYKDDRKQAGVIVDSFYTAGSGSYKLKVIKESGLSDESTPFNINYIDPYLDHEGDTILDYHTSIVLHLRGTLNSSFQWYKNGELIPNAQTDSLLVTQDGEYSALAKSFEDVGHTGSLRVRFYPRTILNKQGDTTMTFGDRLLLYSNTQPTGTTYQWYKDGSPINGANTDSLKTFGTGNFQLQVTNPNGLIDRNSGYQITYHNPYLDHQGDTVLSYNTSLTLHLKGALNSTYQWYKDSILIPDAHADHLTVAEDGVYYAVAQSGVNIGSTGSVKLRFYPQVILNRQGDTTLVFGDKIQLYANAQNPGTIYQWYKDGSAIEGANADHLWTQGTGNYQLQVTTRNGLSDRNTGYQISYANPYLDHEGAMELAAHSALTLHLQGTANSTYQWYKDSLLIPDAHADTLYVTEDGVYYAIAQSVENIGYTGSLKLRFYPEALLNKQQDTTLIFGDRVLLTANAQPVGTTYRWYKDEEVIPAENADHLWTFGAGLFQLEVTNSNGLTNRSATYRINYQKPYLDRTGDTILFYQNSLTLHLKGAVNSSFQWYKDDELISGMNADSLYIDQDATYYAKASSGGTILSTGVFRVRIYPRVILDKTGDTVLAFGDKILLHANKQPAGTIYQWYKNGEAISGENADSLWTFGQGNFQLQVITPGGLIDRNSGYQVSYQNPYLNYQGEMEAAYHSHVVLHIQGAFNSQYQWYKDTMLIAGANADTLLVNTDGTYYATTESAGSSANTGTLHLRFYPKSTLNKTGDTTIIFGDRILLRSTSSNNGTSYEWYKNNTVLNAENSDSLRTSGAGMFTLKLTLPNGLSDESVPYAIHYQNPFLNDEGDTVLNGDTVLMLHIKQTLNSTYEWYKDGMLLAGKNADSLLVTQDGIYYANALSGESIGTTGTLQVKINRKTGITKQYDDFLLDGFLFNDYLHLKIVSAFEGKMDIALYNVMGQLITSFSENKTKEHYEESFPVKNISAGVYMIVVNFGVHNTVKKVYKF